MTEFKINRLVFEKYDDLNEIPIINKSTCEDILSQIIFYKVDQYSFYNCALYNRCR